MALRHRCYLTPPEVAALLRVSPDKVLGWIRRAELRAFNVSDGTRPRYRIRRADLEGFLKRREVMPRLDCNSSRAELPVGGRLDSDLGKRLAKRGQAELVLGDYFRLRDGRILFF